MIITETDITYNGVPLEHLSTADMVQFANHMRIDISGSENDRQSLFALIDNAFLRIKNKHIKNPYKILIRTRSHVVLLQHPNLFLWIQACWKRMLMTSQGVIHSSLMVTSMT